MTTTPRDGAVVTDTGTATAQGGARRRLTLPGEVLEAQELVRPALSEAVGELDASMSEVVSYHLGWTDQQGRAVSGGGGKTLRPALAVLAARAAGGSGAAAIPGATAVELVHNFSLLHDDVMDADTERRQRPTVWWRYGTPTAILAGDALLTLAVDVIEREGNHAATSCVTGAVRELIDGQRRDVGFEERADVELAECLDMARGKTAALMHCAARVGALLTDASEDVAEALGGFGSHLGMAFQLVDDLLGIWGDPQVTGKPVLSDLRARKRTVPVVAAIDSGTAAGSELARRYQETAHSSQDDLAGMAELIERSGALDWTEAEADRHISRARADLDRVNAPRAIHEALHQFASFVTERAR